MQPIFVLSGNVEQFVCWCCENKVSIRSPLVKYISSHHDVRGAVNPLVWVQYGTATERVDYLEVLDVINSRLRPVKAEPAKQQITSPVQNAE